MRSGKRALWRIAPPDRRLRGEDQKSACGIGGEIEDIEGAAKDNARDPVPGEPEPPHEIRRLLKLDRERDGQVMMKACIEPKSVAARSAA